jgi:SAM-dependent methyltransferase
VKATLLRTLDRVGLLRPAYGAYERLQALSARMRQSGAEPTDGLPLPPPQLIVRVAGTSDASWFLEGGQLAAEGIQAALERTGRPIAGLGSILDFGCGCGRVTRRWRALRGVEIHGSDANAEAIEWCRVNLPFGDFEMNGLAPPLVYADDSFDAIYALSVLTHLPEKLGLAWRDELRRVLRPNGLLIVSTHGAVYREKLTEVERGHFDRGELVVRWESAAGTNLCAAYHPEPYIRSRLAEGFELVEHVPRGAAGNPHQDLTVLFKK